MEKINWSLFNTMQEKSKHTLCSGEEKLLTTDQINEINDSLATINEHLIYIQTQFNKVRKKFGQTKEI